ncbi:MAG: low molecular weight phosphotyrosine protein phosphatase [Anaerolineales bacterium]|nr:low molecular weight phosphotyrosine protein phosphatase [Anaerolineales bacterium]
MTVTVLFVCLGNICRSPMAESIFQKMVDDAGLSAKINVDSAGTGAWHVGERPHPGTRRVLQQHGIRSNGRARMVRAADMTDPASYIIAMAIDNMDELLHRFGDHPRLFRLLDFALEAKVRDVPDPYYENNFEYVFELVSDGCRGLLTTIRRNEGL